MDKSKFDVFFFFFLVHTGCLGDILYHLRKFIFIYIGSPFGGTRDDTFFLSKE